MGVQQLQPPLRVLGVDPGTLRTGWGVLERRGRTIQFHAAGVLTAKGFHSLPERLRMIYLGLIEVIHTHTPQVLSLEKAFLAYNVQSALRLGEARGVALLAAAQAGLRIAEYSPTAIKTAVVGYGRADKLQVQKSVFALLKGEMTAGNLELPVSKDATDALATAICHLNSSRLTDLIRETRDGRLKAVDWSRPRVRSLRNVLPKGTVEHLLAVAKRKGQE